MSKRTLLKPHRHWQSQCHTSRTSIRAISSVAPGVATLFPNEASLLRLVTAVLVELSDDWETSTRVIKAHQ